MTYIPPEYPNAIPSILDLPDRNDDVDWLYAARYNELKKELRAALIELGILPKGTSATVAERLKGIRSLSDALADVIVIKAGKVGIGIAIPVCPLHINAPLGDTLAHVPFMFVRNTETTATGGSFARGIIKSSGNMANGFGGYMRFEIQDAGAGPYVIARIGAVRDGADNTGKFIIRTTVAGVENDRVYITGNPYTRLNVLGPATSNYQIMIGRGDTEGRLLMSWNDATHIGYFTCAYDGAYAAFYQRGNPLGFNDNNAFNVHFAAGGGKVGIGTTDPKSKLHVVGLPVYANNAAAVTGGLTAGAFYRTGADPDPVCVVH